MLTPGAIFFLFHGLSLSPAALLAGLARQCVNGSAVQTHIRLSFLRAAAFFFVRLIQQPQDHIRAYLLSFNLVERLLRDVYKFVQTGD